MPTKTTTSMLLVAMLALVGAGWGAGSLEEQESSSPTDVTAARMEQLGELLGHRVVELAEGKLLASGLSQEQILEIWAAWTEAVECSVPVGALAMDAAELARFLSTEREEIHESAIAAVMIDGWGNPMEVYLRTDSLPAQPHLVVRSAGANGAFERLIYEAGEFEAGEAEDDLVWSFISFCRSPAEAEEDLASMSETERQKRTVRDLRNLGVALFSWLTDNLAEEMIDGEQRTDMNAPCAPLEESAEADAESGKPAAGYRLQPLGAPLEADEVRAILHPSDTFFYMNEVPTRDGWDEPIEFYVRLDDLNAAQVIAIRSAGSDGEFEGDCYTVGPFDPAESGNDIVWADGFFIRWPENSKRVSPHETAAIGQARGTEAAGEASQEP